MKNKALELTDLAFPISVIQTGKDSFTVQYGKQVKRGLSYAEAAKELGQSIFHALACDGKIETN
jgi:hypothetical protein